MTPHILGMVTEATQVRTSVLQARLVTVRAQMLPVALKHLFPGRHSLLHVVFIPLLRRCR